MAWGLQVKNPAGEIVVDADSIGLHYVGQATFVGTVSRGAGSRYYNRYSITLPSTSHLALAMVKLASNRIVTIQRVIRSAAGSATWYIDCYAIDTASVGQSSFADSPAIDVHAFTQYSTSPAAFGLQLLNSSGHVSWDFGAKPLWVRQVMEFPARSTYSSDHLGDSIALSSGIGTPWVIGRGHGKDNLRVGAAGGHNDQIYGYSTDGTNVLRKLFTEFQEAGESGGSPYTPVPDWSMPAQTVFVMNGGDYA